MANEPKGIIPTPDAFDRIGDATRWVEGQRDSDAGREDTGKKNVGLPAWGQSRWVIVREIPAPMALWMWAEPAKTSDDYADPDSDSYGLYVGTGPPPVEPAPIPGESTEDFNKRKDGWIKMATWPHMFARDYALTAWPVTPTLATDVNVAVKIRGAWHVKPPVERVQTILLEPGTRIGGCRPAGQVANG